MADPVAICNMALGVCGARTTISSLSEGSKAARECKLWYDQALEAVLQATHWNFARKQIALTLLKDATRSPPDAVPQPWLYEYAYPSDCVQGRYIMPMSANMPSSVPGTVSMSQAMGAPPRFLVSSEVDPNSGQPIKVILTNQPQALLVYTTRITDVNLFDGSFVMALAHYLGAKLCMPLSGDKALGKMAYDIADATTREARASNGNEGLTVADSIPDWIRARGYASDWAYPQGAIAFMSPQNLAMVT